MKVWFASVAELLVDGQAQMAISSVAIVGARGATTITQEAIMAPTWTGLRMANLEYLGNQPL